MKVWMLTRKAADVGWDEFDAKIVLADNQPTARVIANQNTGDEGKIWEHLTAVTCVEITLDGKPRELLGSFRAG